MNDYTVSPETWFSKHELVFQIICLALYILFYVGFICLMKDSSYDTFFTRLCKIWMLIGLTFKIVFSIATLVLILHSGEKQSLFDSKFVIKHYRIYVDLFQVGPMLVMLLPMHAICQEWFLIVLLVR